MTAEIDAAHDQLAREHKSLTSEAAMPELPDPSLAWEDLPAEDRRALTEMLIDKIVIAPHPHKIVDGRRHYLIRAIPYQDPEMEAERLKAVHEARSRSSPESEQQAGHREAERHPKPLDLANRSRSTRSRRSPSSRDPEPRLWRCPVGLADP